MKRAAKELQVAVYQEGPGIWFAQGVQIDNLVQDKTRDDVVRRYAARFITVVEQHRENPAALELALSGYAKGTPAEDRPPAIKPDPFHTQTLELGPRVRFDRLAYYEAAETLAQRKAARAAPAAAAAS